MTRTSRLHHTLRGLAILSSLLAPATLRAQAQPDGGVALPACTGTLCGFSHPEDLAALPGTRWIVVSQQSDEDPTKGMVLLDTTSGQSQDIPNPPAGDGCITGRGGGLGVRPEQGGFRVVRIVHGKADVVETWRLAQTPAGITASRTACTPAPEDLFLNDIAPLAGEGFVTTHMFDRSLPKDQRDAMFRNDTPTGVLMRWTAASGWARIPGSEGVFPNGVDVSPSGRWIAFAETYGHRLNRIRPDGRDRSSVTLAMQPDNVTAVDDTHFVVVGGTGVPLVSTRNCAPLGKAGCAFPSAAILVDFAHLSQKVLVRSEGHETPGISTGLIADGALWLGTSFGDRVTRVVLPAGNAPAPNLK